VERVGRLLSGKGIGLVLSGGGARGFAHIGALRAIREEGIPIDRVGGTSIGSIVAAMTALLWDYPTMLEQASSFNYRMDYTFPAVAVTAGKNLTAQLKKRFGDQEIEDLWISFFCVSTDLNESRLRVHERGLLWKYVRASASIPGLFPPIIDGEAFLVDGGIVNNMPVDIMQGYEDIGTVIAVDVSAPERLQSGLPMTGSLSGWRVLTEKLLWFRPRVAVPSLAKILVLSALTKSAEINEHMRKIADFYVRLPVRDYGMLEFNKIKCIAETGYYYTREQLATWNWRAAADRK
jgi:predicted acylesterase/phospholipase RssA